MSSEINFWQLDLVYNCFGEIYWLKEIYDLKELILWEFFSPSKYDSHKPAWIYNTNTAKDITQQHMYLAS